MSDNAHSPPIRVLINALHARSGGGVTYLRNILPPLASDPGLELHLCLHQGQLPVLGALPPNVSIKAVHFRDGFLRRLIWEQWGLPVLAGHLGADVTFSPANFGPLWGPRSVVLLRNTIAAAGSEQRPTKRLYWSALSAMTVLSLFTCRSAIAVSAYAKKELTRHLPLRVQEKVKVVHHGVSSAFRVAGDLPREGFILAVGDIYVQKNLARLLVALAELRREFPYLRLEIAGQPVDEEHANELRAMAAKLKLEDSVVFLGHVGPDRLAELYRTCCLFVFPSMAETFGNPLVEAMASGAPIASSHATAMPEILGEAGVYFDPLDVADIARCIRELLRDAGLRERLSRKAIERSLSFSWEETARRTADILKAAGRSAVKR